MRSCRHVKTPTAARAEKRPENRARAWTLRVLVVLAFLSHAPLCLPAQEAAEPAPAQDRIVLGAPKRTARFELEQGLREQIRRFLAPGSGLPGTIALLAVAAAYGVIHALGPGHQKTLLAGYFLSEGGTVGKAALAAVASSILHAVSVLAIFGGLAVAARSFSDAERSRALLTRASGIALLAIAVIMAARRIAAAVRRLRPAQPHPAHGDPGHEHHASCPTCGRMERARARGASFWPVLLAGGVVPCPGAAFFLLFGVSAGNIPAGVLAVLAISAGMAVTLFLVALGASAARTAALRSSAKSGRTRDLALSIVEITGSVVMLAFAAVMVF